MLSGLFLVWLGGGILGYLVKGKVDSFKETKRANSQFLLEEAKIAKEKETFFEQFFLSFTTDDKWQKYYTIGAKGVPLYKHENGLRFTLKDFNHNTKIGKRKQAVWYGACIFRKVDENAPMEVIHTFNDEELKRLNSFILSQEAEKLTGF